jgi:predicted nucleotidyltransferase
MATETALNLPADLREALDQAVAAIVEIAHPQLIILFGSWAEGTARADSDVDLLVVAETERWDTTALALHKILRPLLGRREFDLLLYSPEEWREGRRVIGFVSREADQQGVRLYDRAA